MALPEGGGELERTNPGEWAKRREFSVGDLLHCTVEAFDVVSFQDQHRLAGVHVVPKERGRQSDSKPLSLL